LSEETVRRREQDTGRRQAEEENRRRSHGPAGPGMGKEPFDPYTILGVPRDTSLGEIRSAYREARLKYDQDQVSHLSDEVQQHFRAKAQAIERAYHMLEERR